MALFALLLNAAWEFVQCTIFYRMWDWGFWRATAWMWGAILGDVVIVLGVALVAALLVGAQRLCPPDRQGWAALLIVGFVASIALEWLARTLHLWNYNPWMPTLEVASYTVGLSPVVQVTVLPALSVYLAASRRVKST